MVASEYRFIVKDGLTELRVYGKTSTGTKTLIKAVPPVSASIGDLLARPEIAQLNRAEVRLARRG